MLGLLQGAVDAGDASPRHLAYLTDRVLVAAGEPQVYGTRYTQDPDGGYLRPHAVTDPGGLDARRAAVGLEPTGGVRLADALQVPPAEQLTSAGGWPSGQLCAVGRRRRVATAARLGWPCTPPTGLAACLLALPSAERLWLGGCRESTPVVQRRPSGRLRVRDR
ncbi:DUF6624 domain-containing protein [Streptomyces sp. NPDC056632]|uniref:DUF6624 domain-containing protein n=1 Tax=Streptomyces sp. NPDC056632 TaxID=3345884 RepID=UPI003681278B